MPPLPSAAEVTTSRLARWGLFGRNGAGKTTFLSTIPKDYPTWVLAADNENMDPLVGHEHIKTPILREWKQMGDYYEMVRKAYSVHPRAWEKFPGIPRVVAFDTWTRMQALAANMLTKYTPAEFEVAQKYIETAPRLPKGWEAWQQIGALASEWMRNWERLPVHLIFLFQEQEKESREGSELSVPKIGPMMTPLAVQAAKDTLKIIGRLYVVTEKAGGDDKIAFNPAQASAATSLREIDEDVTERRKLLLGEHPLYVTKGPVSKLGYVVTEPTWAKLAASLE